MKEMWKDIKNFEGMYQISNFGRVKSLARTKKHSYNGIAQLKEKVLKPVNINGYKRVVLSKNNKSINKYIHFLVAQAFIPNPNNYSEINHKDEDKANNKINNLEWCNHSYNINYGTGNQRRSQKEIKTKRGDDFVY